MKALISGMAVAAFLLCIAVGGARLAGIQMDGAGFGALFVISVFAGCGAVGIVVVSSHGDR